MPLLVCCKILICLFDVVIVVKSVDWNQTAWIWIQFNCLHWFLVALCLACAQNTAPRTQHDFSDRQHISALPSRRNKTNQAPSARPLAQGSHVWWWPGQCAALKGTGVRSLRQRGPIPSEGRPSGPRADVAATWLMPLWRAGLIFGAVSSSPWCEPCLCTANIQMRLLRPIFFPSAKSVRKRCKMNLMKTSEDAFNNKIARVTELFVVCF